MIKEGRSLWDVKTLASAAVVLTGLSAPGAMSAQAEEMSNACPVDGCIAKIVKTELADGEIAVTFEANFKPDMSKNHLHVWWGDVFDIKQVSGNAETVHNVKQGDWHPTDAYPAYVTQGAVSTNVRNESKTLCVSPADRNHDILDVDQMHCVEISGLF